MHLRPFLLIAVATLSGCAVDRPPACRAGEHLLALDTLYFGTASPVGTVSSEQWRAFVEEVVSVEFPKGYTVLRGDGGWRGESGKLQLEESYVLQLVHEDGAAADEAIGRITERYKQRFQQESVLRVRAPGCASF